MKTLLTLGTSQPFIVLLVEDCLEDRKTIERYLLAEQKDKYKIFEAQNAEEGLDLYQQCQPDIVLLDYQLPDSDGLELLEQIQQAGNGNCCPIVLLTGQGNEQVAVQAMKAGACDYLVKGQVTPQEMRLAVSGALENARLRAKLRQAQAERDRQIEQEKLIAQIANQIHSRLDINEIFDATVSEVRQFLKCDRVLIYRFDPDGNGAIVAESVGDGWLSILNARVEDTYFVETQGKNARQGRIQAVADIYNANLSECHINLLARFQIRANLAVPILKENSLWGLLVANQCSAPRQWQSQNIELLKQLTTQVGIALQQRELYERLQIELSDRQRAEASLQEANQRILTIWDSMTDAYVLLDREWRLTYTNQAARCLYYQLTHLEPEAFLGKTHWEIFPWTVGTIVEQQYQRAMTQQVAVHFEVLYEPTQDWFEVHAYPSAEGLGIYFRDINERKRAEIALRNSEQRNASLAKLSPVGIFQNARDGINCFYANERACEIVGLSHEEVLGKDWLDALHPDDRERVIQQWQQTIRENIPFQSEYRFLHADGTIRWVIGQAIAETDENKRVIGYIGALSDISDLKQAQAALQESESKYRTLFERMDEGFCICEMLFDADGKPIDYRFVEVNPVFEKMTGLKQARGKTARELVPNLEDFWVETYGRVVLTGEPVRFENQSLAMNRWFDVNAFRLEEPQSHKFAVLFSNISDRKGVEQRLLESEKLLRLGMQVAGFALAKFDYASDTVALSPKAAALYGLPISQLIVPRSRLHATFHPEERAELAEIIERVLDPEGQGGFARDHRVVWSNGEVRWLSVRKQVFFDRSGEFPRPQYAILAALDISDRKRVQLNAQFLNELDLRLRQLPHVEAMEWEVVRSLGEYLKVDRCLWHEIDWENRLTTVERDWRREDVPDLAGIYALEEYFTPKQLNDFAAGQTMIVGDVTTHPDTAPYAQNYLPLGVAAFVSIPCIRSGRWVAVLAVNAKTARNWRDDEIVLMQEIVARLWSLIEQTRAVQALRESEERFQTFMNNSPFAVFIKDESGCLTYANRRVEQLFNKSSGELVGSKDFGILPEAIVQEIQEHDRQVFETGAASEFIETIPNEAGKLTYWLTVKFLLSDRNREPLLGGVAVDITDRLKAEQRLRQQSQELIHLNTELEQTTEQLIERNEELNRFVYVVSHDLKAPLRAISNLSQWLIEDLEEKLDEDNRHNIELLQNRVYRMEAMIDGLLTYSRVGRTEVETTTFDVGELLDEIIDSLAPPPTFTIEVQSSMPTMTAKRLLLSQVFSNLISNALKHHPRTDGRIEIKATQKKQYYEFSVTDDGEGIAKENHKQIFNIFQTIKGQDTKDSTGIGLSIVKKIIETEGGEIAVESELGSGATFRFTWLVP